MRVTDKVTDAVVIAAGRVKDPELASAAVDAQKSLIPINGRPAVSYVVENLTGCSRVSRTIVVADADVRAAAGRADVFVDGFQTVDQAVLAGIEAVRDSTRCLLMTADLPLASAEAVADFLDSAPDSDIVYPIVEKSDVKAAFPDRLSSYVHLAEGDFTGSSCLLFKPHAALKRNEMLRRLLGARDNPTELAGILGFGFAMKLMLGGLSLRDVEARLSEVFELECRAFVTSRPELLLSIDTVEDRDMVEKALRG